MKYRVWSFCAAALGCWLAAGSVAGAREALSFDAAGHSPALQVSAVSLDNKASLADEAKAVRLTPAQRAGLELGNVTAVQLAPVDRDKLFAEDMVAPRPGLNKVLRIGVGRDLELREVDGSWYELPDGGRLWVAEVAGDRAVGLRLGFSRLALPRGVEVAVYAPDVLDADKQYREFGRTPAESAEEIEFLDTVGSVDKAAGVHWTRILFGERARVELYVPARLAATQTGLPFTLDRAQYIYRDPLFDEALSKAAGPCHNDVACFPEWAQTARGVARISYVRGGSSFLCTGQLLNTFASDFTPFFLTANHCINTSASASSATFFWLYQKATCGGAVPSLASLRQSSNASLVSTHPASDYSLLMINGTVPININLTWLGWNAGGIANNIRLASIHHPSGDHKRISFGTKASNPVCGGANHFRLNWTDGPTEPGSSGGGAFLANSKQLVGQLHCGPASCSNESNDSYGAFQHTYTRIRTSMAGGSDDNSEQNDTCATARQVNIGTLANRVVKRNDDDWYRITVPARKRLRVTLTFTHAWGDIDIRAYRTCGGAVVASSAGVTNTEVLNYTNGNASSVIRWRVNLHNDVRATYTQKVEIL